MRVLRQRGNSSDPLNERAGDVENHRGKGGKADGGGQREQSFHFLGQRRMQNIKITKR